MSANFSQASGAIVASTMVGSGTAFGIALRCNDCHDVMCFVFAFLGFGIPFVVMLAKSRLEETFPSAIIQGLQSFAAMCFFDVLANGTLTVPCR